MLQDPVEFQRLLNLYCDRQPTRVLEVGVDQGGTLWRWLNLAPAGAHITALDDRHRRRDEYHYWTPSNVTLTVIQGDSRDPDTILEVAERRPYDWVFIDADHTDAAVRADWHHYAAMTMPGAVVALHDIAPSPAPEIQVDGLWRELATQHHVLEIIEPGAPGIGVVFMPAEEVSH